jgi:hypothetical protein
MRCLSLHHRCHGLLRIGAGGDDGIEGDHVGLELESWKMQDMNGYTMDI